MMDNESRGVPHENEQKVGSEAACCAEGGYYGVEHGVDRGQSIKRAVQEEGQQNYPNYEGNDKDASERSRSKGGGTQCEDQPGELGAESYCAKLAASPPQIDCNLHEEQ